MFSEFALGLRLVELELSVSFSIYILLQFNSRRWWRKRLSVRCRLDFLQEITIHCILYSWVLSTGYWLLRRGCIEKKWDLPLNTWLEIWRCYLLYGRRVDDLLHFRIYELYGSTLALTEYSLPMNSTFTFLEELCSPTGKLILFIFL